MKISRMCSLGAMAGLLVAASCAAEEAAAQEPALATPADQVSYLIGRQIGDSLSAQELEGELNLEVLIAALRDAIAKKPSAIPQAKAQEIMQGFGTKMREKLTAARQAQGETNKKDGQAFLETNKTAEGWAVTGSGLQYKVIKNGDGKKPALTDTVEVHYRGTLVNGTEFDSSYKRNAPAVFPLKTVIKGWQEALQLMPVGSKWEVVLPPELAYGATGKGREIGPDAVLKFEIELLSIKEPAPDAAPEANQ
jgi:FKBP-type peptidyl-prolyl cis-trans isomerase